MLYQLACPCTAGHSSGIAWQVKLCAENAGKGSSAAAAVLLSAIQPSATTLAPKSSNTFTVSIVDLPVVTASSTTEFYHPQILQKFLRSSIWICLLVAFGEYLPHQAACHFVRDQYSAHGRPQTFCYFDSRCGLLSDSWHQLRFLGNLSSCAH